MDLRSRFEFESKGIAFFSIFYFVAGVANFIILGMYGLGLFHVSLVAVLSLIAGFGVYSMRTWSLWIVVALFFIATTYGAVMLNTFLAAYSGSSGPGNLFAVLVSIIYLILTWMATIYVAARRKSLR